MKSHGRLTTAGVEAASPGKHSDGAGLTLVVKPSGRRSWVARVSVGGRRCDLGLGGYPAVSLDEARREAARLRAEAAACNGRSSASQARRPGGVPTFAQTAAEVHALHEPCWRSPLYAQEWLASLHRHAALLMDLRVDRITRTQVLDVLHPIWNEKPATARRVRQRIRTVLSYAMALHEHIPSNAAGDGIDAALPRMPRVRSHQRALHYRDVPAALAAIEQTGSSPAARLCLRFAVLTAARSGEARGARWSEIESADIAWRIPGERMKSGTEHRVPLSRRALDVLDAARDLNDGSGLIFPSPLKPAHPLSPQALLKLLRSNDLDSTVHGFRSSFKTWTIEATTTPWAVGEAALAHVVGNSTEAAYVRGDLFEQRRELMTAWADFVAPCRRKIGWCPSGRSATVGSASLPGLCGDLPGIERAPLSAATNSEAR
ncbi:MAG: integrase arm-type DNA-binding domain-containing protein [Acidimicrobiaceae bacterium]|nr:integrase arm-type DNA-binding domain-containing protein [Acidimicrobiaceae bacterium]